MKTKSNLLNLIISLLAISLILVPGAFLTGCKSSGNVGVTALPGGSSYGGAYGSYNTAQSAATLQGQPAGPTPALPYSREELWVIARDQQASSQDTDASPGSGALMAKVEGREVPMPLKHTDVQASINGYISAVEVSQQFHNPYSSKIEAVYVFPLPHDAAINEFIMTIGDRRIRGIIRERKEAEQIYQDAKRAGHVASLLTEERPNVFTQSVANIEPGKEIGVNIKYYHTLAWVDGWYEFVFPTVVGPRFNPAGFTNGVGAVARGNQGASGQTAEVPYPKPGENTAHDLSLKLDVNAGLVIEDFECRTHRLIQQPAAPHHLAFSLDPTDGLPNKDFVFRFRVAGERIKASLLTRRDPSSTEAGYFTLMLYPPRELESLSRQPLELVFVLDCSGSMDGRPIEQAKAAVARGLALLKPEDTFQLITFSMHASKFGNAPLPANDYNVHRAQDYLASLRGEGGTMMIEGIKAALDFPHDPRRLRFVCFLTDGYIGNEAEILEAIHRQLGPARIFSFGIGSAVNRYLIEQMGKVGRGAVAFLGPRDEAAQIMADFFQRISHPALTDLKLDWGGLNVTDVFPRELPDIFPGRPVVLTGRFTGPPNGVVRVSGKAAGETLNIPVSADTTPGAADNKGLPMVWARSKIDDLAEQSIFEPGPSWADEIKHVALDYGLMSAFTAFVAVDSTRTTAGKQGTTVPVAVPVPEGVNYETTVKEK